MPQTSAALRIVNALGFIIYAVLTGLGAANIHTINANRLPIPIIDRVLGLALPLVQLVITLLIACGFRPAQFLHSQTASDRARRQRLVSIANFVLWLLSILDTILLSTSTFALDPQTLDCNLDSTWREWFENKNAGSIRTIQDSFDCCGFHRPVDKAWPFPGGKINQHGCEERFGRNSGCLTPWKASTRKVLITFTAIGAVSIALKLLLAVLYTFMQVDDFGFVFRTRTAQNDPARQRLLDQEDRSDPPPINEGNGVQNSSIWDAAR